METRQSNPVAVFGQYIEDRVKTYVALARQIVDHGGERGRVAEAVVAAALRNFLPLRYSIGTGFIVDHDGRTSSQQDIVIYDHFDNTPIMIEGGLGIFPIECVYATIEVKLTIDRPRFEQAISAVERVRELARSKQSVSYDAEHAAGGARVVKRICGHRLAPRSYIFAMTAKGLSHEDLGVLMQGRPDAHLHGVIFMEERLHYGQRAYDKTRVVLPLPSAERAFLSFLLGVRDGVQSFPIHFADMAPYLDPSAPRVGGNLQET